MFYCEDENGETVEYWPYRWTPGDPGKPASVVGWPAKKRIYGELRDVVFVQNCPVCNDEHFLECDLHDSGTAQCPNDPYYPQSVFIVTPPQSASPYDFQSNCGFVYFILRRSTFAVKIGFAMSPKRRMRSLQTGNDERLLLLAVKPSKAIDEKSFHRQFASSRIRGEWFRLTVDLLLEIDDIRSTFRQPKTVVSDLSATVFGAARKDRR